MQTQKKSQKRKGPTIEGNPQKLRKTSRGKAKPGSSANTSNTAPCPAWLEKARTLFKSEELGSEWDLLISNWLKFEEDSQFQGTGQLGCQKRPWGNYWLDPAREVFNVSPRYRRH